MISLEWRNMSELVWEYPEILLTPIFSYWTMGPVYKTLRSCCGHNPSTNTKVGVSFCFTFVNALLTICGSFVCYAFTSANYNSIDNSKCYSFGKEYRCDYFQTAIITIASLLFVSLLCTVLLKCCKSNCCSIPLTQKSHFDINELDEQEDENKEELGQEMNVL